MKKQIPSPSNWTDFEDFCKRVFGEIWNCKHTIKKNGRGGQKQHGVDVYGFPDGGTKLYGVQCKGKDNNFGKGLTEKEIDKEIKLAQGFGPSLDVFVFATTAPKDSKIEQYILKKHLESVNNSGFEILLYDWDDLADFIRTNESLSDWYLKDQQFETNKSVQISLNGEAENLIVTRKLQMTRYLVQTAQLKKSLERDTKLFGAIQMHQQSLIDPFRTKKINYSWTVVEMAIHNTGTVTLEDWKVWVRFGDDIDMIRDDYEKGLMGLSLGNIEDRTVYTYEDDKEFLCLPYKEKPLVPHDSRTFTLKFLAFPNVTETVIDWELISRHHHGVKGQVKIQFQPDYENKYEFVDTEEELQIANDKEISYLIKENTN